MTSSLVSRFTIWDYLVFCAMLAVSTAIGVYYAFFGTKKVSTDEFLMGGRQLSAFPVALSILASFMSAITLLGTASEMYLAGTQYVVICVSYCFVIPATAYFYMPIFHHLQLTSAYEYLEIRFNKVIRSMGSVTFSLQMLIYMSIVLYAPALALSQVTGISTWTSVLSLGFVCTFYTSIGGMKAVVWTDVFQIGLMFGSMITVVIRGTIDLGGLGYVFDRASEGGRLELFNLNPSPTERHTVFGMTIGTFFTWMSVYGVSQAMVQRYLTIPTIQGARKAVWINLPGLSFLMLICAMAGLVMYARYHDCDPIMTKKVSAPDQLLPLYVMDILGKFKGVPGLFVSGIFSGALSTVSSGVNSLAAVTLEDVVKRYIVEDMSDRSATTLTKVLALTFGCTAIALVYAAQNMGNVLQAALSIFGIVGGPLLGVFTLGIFFPFANSIGAGVGIVTSLVVTFWIGIGAFYYKPAHRMARRSVLGCLQEYINVTHQNPANVTFPVLLDPDVANKEILYVYRISYVWYSMIASMLVVFVGIIVSLITGPYEPSKVNPRSIHPIYNCLVKKLATPSVREKLMVRSEEAYDWDRMVELGRRTKDHAAHSPPSRELIEAPSDCTVAETPAPDSAVIPVPPATIALPTAATGDLVPARLDMPPTLLRAPSSPAPSEPFDVAGSRAVSPSTAIAGAAGAPQVAQPRQAAADQQPNGLQEAATPTGSAHESSEAGGAAPAK
ncbi:sodium-coupled monocarboxylate transporter 1-like [Dermacentor albipictus]|uniref:sodium-coupled monocarboxylate transporter 1-like n=1 Tax=Dermacentor albipictus TaxID=60249 RepID=UPI0031FDD6CB